MRYLIIFFLLISLVGCSSVGDVEYKDTTFEDMYENYTYFKSNDFKDDKIVSEVDVDILGLDREKNSLLQYTYFVEDEFDKLYFVFYRNDVEEKIELDMSQQENILERIYNNEVLISENVLFDEFKSKIDQHISESLENLVDDLFDSIFN